MALWRALLEWQPPLKGAKEHTMKGLAVDRNKQLWVPQLSMPRYNDCQALVKTLACGVCNGTDLKLVHGTFKNMDEYPMLLGHEGVGRVVEVGKHVTKYAVGDMVLLPFLYEKQDGFANGWGAYAEYAVVGDERAFALQGAGPSTPGYDEGCTAQSVIPAGNRMSAVEASMVITFREVLSAMRRFGFAANESIVIFGAGPVGLCFTVFARLLGMAPVITVDILDEKTHQATALGAHITLNSQKQDVEQEIRRLLPQGADNLVDAVGVNALLNQAMKLVKNNGKVCGYGISPQLSMSLDWSEAPYNWSLCFVQFPSKYEEMLAHSQIMAWIERGVLRPSDFITDVFPFEKILDAFALAEQKKSTTGKVVIQYEEA